MSTIVLIVDTFMGYFSSDQDSDAHLTQSEL
ncbi:hypothetical protein VCB_003366 [Vibrio cholerae TMA 21]|nr:hypothetical protein VCB_003366 [Vibrio cholerae TMA 21]